MRYRDLVENSLNLSQAYYGLPPCACGAGSSPLWRARSFSPLIDRPSDLKESEDGDGPVQDGQTGCIPTIISSSSGAMSEENTNNRVLEGGALLSQDGRNKDSATSTLHLICHLQDDCVPLLSSACIDPEEKKILCEALCIHSRALLASILRLCSNFVAALQSLSLRGNADTFCLHISHINQSPPPPPSSFDTVLLAYTLLVASR